MKNHPILAAMAFLVSAMFAPSLTAQELTIDPGVILTQGGSAKLHYADANKAGQTIVVVITNSTTPVQQFEIQITLDSSGAGDATWNVPSNWRAANFTAPGVKGVTLPVVPPASGR